MPLEESSFGSTRVCGTAKCHTEIPTITCRLIAFLVDLFLVAPSRVNAGVDELTDVIWLINKIRGRRQSTTVRIVNFVYI